MIKAIFFDMDGTLFSHRTHRIPESARAALETLSKRGIRCVAATGRHIREMTELFGDGSDRVFDGYVTLNGQLCWDADRNCIFSNPIAEPDRSTVVRMFEQKELPILLLQKDAICLNYVDDFVVRVQADISTLIPTLGNYDGRPFYQAIVYADSQREIALAAQLTASKIVRWHDFAIDVIPNNGDKAVGVAAYLKANGIDPQEAMAFGDGGNDMEMLRLVGTGIAMGNAVEELKRIADYVTADADEDGVERALLHFGLIEPVK